jgi:hypothetical protein
MVSVRQLITGSLRLINVVQSGEVPSPDDMSIALQAFTQMVDSYSEDRLMVYNIDSYLVNTVAGQSTYLLGPGNPVTTFGGLTPGSLYVPGVYINVPLTGGSGSGALATVTVSSGGLVSSIIIPANGTGGTAYKVNDIISASNINLGGSGSGFTATVTAIGSGDWNLQRPVRIEQSYVVWLAAQSAQTVDIPLAQYNDAQFASISVKNTPSTFPFAMYDDGAFPLRAISVWPVPTVSTQLRLWLRMPLVDFTSLDAQISYPPGYERMFRFNLAVELAAEFGKTVTQEIIEIANLSKAVIQKLNAVPQYMMCDGSMNAPRKGFNYVTGGFLPWGGR